MLRPRTSFISVIENGTYEANGSHPIPGRDEVDFAGLAKAAGYRGSSNVWRVWRISERNVGAFFNQSGPMFAALKVVPGETTAF